MLWMAIKETEEWLGHISEAIISSTAYTTGLLSSILLSYYLRC